MRELLVTVDSRELAEWRAYDRVYGLGDEHVHEVLADIHEQLQLLNHLTGAAHFTKENEPDTNPVPKPERYPRGRDQRPNLWEE